MVEFLWNYKKANKYHLSTSRWSITIYVNNPYIFVDYFILDPRPFSPSVMRKREELWCRECGLFVVQKLLKTEKLTVLLFSVF